MFQCYYSECGKTYKTRFNLRRHINSSHLKIKGFKCPECNKPFVSKQNLKEHHYIHTGEKPFPCDEPGCSKRFRQVSQLSIHKRIHYRQRIGNKTLVEIPEFQLSHFCRISKMAPQVEESFKFAVCLPGFKDLTDMDGLKLPVIPCLLSMKK
jgi:uncharacterized Zn-finger protein